MVARKILVACISHETNTFSPVPTPLSAFAGPRGLLRGDAARTAFRDTGTATGGLIALAERSGADVSVPLIARCAPSAAVEDDAFEALAGELCSAVAAAREAGECDALFLELHGAMVTRSHEDGEGEILRRLRAAAPDLPIALSLDFHGNVTAEMVRSVTSVVAYKTFPHLDMRDCGMRTGQITLDAMAGRIDPVTVWGNVPLLTHLQRMNTSEPPLAGLIALAREAEAEPGVLAVSVLPGFPLADTREAGMSCIVMTDGDAVRAAAIRDRILGEAWSQRAEFAVRPVPLAESVADAAGLPGRPWLLLDVADTCNSGGTLDSMSLLREIRRQGLRNVAAAPVCDRAAVQEMLAAGQGAELEVALGGKMQAPSVPFANEPLVLRGRVAAMHDGEITVTGPVFTGTRLNPGPTVLFESGDLQIVVTSNRIEPYDEGIFRCVGLDPREKDFIVLKSRMQCKPAFLPFCAGHVDCNGIGVTTSDYGAFDYRRLRRPIFPLDDDADWAPAGAAGLTAAT
ncbi:M81 family metallopeptidase [Paralimibaculum aggregatum]|uniref:Microcystinase C n=1 Tax=Paralimibaculum aggregatum TaxID=3036245 RepID=A0ABQ6LML8_9RHOB|nr:M81 family metallopeptidase [Limibaculum sp. NKW23]GMG82468.1 M81 family metallopeptidase [Limibaculum sp. NKW23]